MVGDALSSSLPHPCLAARPGPSSLPLASINFSTGAVHQILLSSSFPITPTEQTQGRTIVLAHQCLELTYHHGYHVLPPQQSLCNTNEDTTHHYAVKDTRLPTAHVKGQYLPTRVFRLLIIKFSSFWRLLFRPVLVILFPFRVFGWGV